MATISSRFVSTLHRWPESSLPTRSSVTGSKLPEALLGNKDAEAMRVGNLIDAGQAGLILLSAGNSICTCSCSNGSACGGSFLTEPLTSTSRLHVNFVM